MKYLIPAFIIGIVGSVLLSRGRVVMYFPFTLIEVLCGIALLCVGAVFFFRK